MCEVVDASCDVFECARIAASDMSHGAVLEIPGCEAALDKI